MFLSQNQIKNTFKCNEWAKFFIPSSSDILYYNSECINAGNNLEKLVANHKKTEKKGLSAIIVISVVVVTAVVLLVIIINNI